MKLQEALNQATVVKELLLPHCDRVEIAGSIRRQKPEVKNIEIVAIPKPYEVGLFASGVATVINQWPAVKGELPCRYTQRILPSGIKLDLFFANPFNWGLIFAIRTGSAKYSHKVLSTNWVKRGYVSKGGILLYKGNPIPVREEKDLFRIIRIDYVEHNKREL